MKPASSCRPRGFTLLETVIAIGVLAVLLTGFIVVFTPAADGIRKSLNLQQADRMASAVEQELVTLRGSTETTNYKTGFNKSFDWIKKSNSSTDAFLVYQYRGAISNPRANDGTPTPVVSLTGMQPGIDYVVVPMCRRVGDTLFAADLAAIEGGVYLVKCTQLRFSRGQLIVGTAGSIVDPKSDPPLASASADAYPEAVIAFAAEFYSMPSKSADYFTNSSNSAFKTKFTSFKNPVFTRNLAVRR